MIGRVIEKTKQSFPIADILVVNHGSADSTSAVTKQKDAMVLDLSCNTKSG